MSIKKDKKPRRLKLTAEQEDVLLYGKKKEYKALIESLDLSGKRAVELLSVTGMSLHVHHGGQ